MGAPARRALHLGPGRDLPAGHGRGRRRRRRRQQPALPRLLGVRAGLVGVRRARRRGERPAERHLAGAGDPRRLHARRRNNQLYQKYWTSSAGWSDFSLLGGGLTSGVSAHGVGREPPRHLRPRRRQRRLHQVLPGTQLGQLGAAGRRRELGARSDLARPRPPGGRRPLRRVHRQQQLLEHLVGLAQPRPRPALPGARRAHARRPVERRAAPAGRLRLHPPGRPRAGPGPRACSATAA